MLGAVLRSRLLSDVDVARCRHNLTNEGEPEAFAARPSSSFEEVRQLVVGDPACLDGDRHDVR